ncbi:hypothetical protein BX666DRAFT_2028314 [Dichotomocladium elegans]|nr:hypothetical protein BX666DRAFT_2028314 [Dichotomocladium elegans]
MPPIFSSVYTNPVEQRGPNLVKVSDASSQAVHIRLVPHISFSSSHCYVFDVIEREIDADTTLKLGRYRSSHEGACRSCLSFKSKVVSRSHADIWCRDGNVYIRDVGSSSGTFVNRARLGHRFHHQLHDGDVIQLGIDYQNGVEPAYRAVRMKIEIRSLDHTRPESHPTITSNSNSSSTRGLKGLASELPTFSKAAYGQILSRFASQDGERDQDCCICLSKICPSQALFVAPCFHIFHFKCLHLFIAQHFPAFLCPLCRTYSDLNASVALEDLQRQRGQEEDEQLAMVGPLGKPALPSAAASLNGVSDDNDGGNNGGVVVVVVSESRAESRMLPRRDCWPLSYTPAASSAPSSTTCATARKSRSLLPCRSADKRHSFLANAIISSPSYLKQVFGYRSSNE